MILYLGVIDANIPPIEIEANAEIGGKYELVITIRPEGLCSLDALTYNHS